MKEKKDNKHRKNSKNINKNCKKSPKSSKRCIKTFWTEMKNYNKYKKDQTLDKREENGNKSMRRWSKQKINSSTAGSKNSMMPKWNWWTRWTIKVQSPETPNSNSKIHWRSWESKIISSQIKSKNWKAEKTSLPQLRAKLQPYLTKTKNWGSHMKSNWMRKKKS